VAHFSHIIQFSEEELQEYLSLGTVIKKKKQYAMVLHYRTIVFFQEVSRAIDLRQVTFLPLATYSDLPLGEKHEVGPDET
jgi:hypothetical protein